MNRAVADINPTTLKFAGIPLEGALEITLSEQEFAHWLCDRLQAGPLLARPHKSLTIILILSGININ